MSFSENTEKVVNVLIDEEYKNACSKYGFEYHSLHEAYAVLLEEVEELESSYNEIKKYVEILWDNIKGNSTYYYNEECIEKILEEAICAISEAAQVGAVLMKIKNTFDEVEADALSIKEFDTNKILTCVTADQAKVGMKGYFADSLETLEDIFRNKIVYTLEDIDKAVCSHRFYAKGFSFALFYPIDEVEE